MSSTRWFGTAALATSLGMLGAMGLSEPPAAAAAEDPGEVRLEVDLSERRLHLYHQGELVNSYAVAVGEPEYPTPTGDFQIDRLIWNPAWVPPPNTEWGKKHDKKDPNEEDNPMVGAKLFFEYPDYYIHGTDAPHTLGEAESHGCIRMDPQEVLDLAEFVQEHAGEDRSEAWFDRVAADDESKHEVTLPDPVPITVHE